jgi:hypothetical protein
MGSCIACPGDERTYLQAASGGHLFLFIRAHENGSPWDLSSYSSVKYGHLTT